MKGEGREEAGSRKLGARVCEEETGEMRHLVCLQQADGGVNFCREYGYLSHEFRGKME